MRIFKMVSVLLVLTLAIAWIVSNMSPSSMAQEKKDVVSTSDSNITNLKVNYALTKTAKNCVECHAKIQPGIVNDWKNSRHSHSGVSCIDCHQQEKGSPMAAQNCEGVKGTDIYLSIMVTPKTCAKCHPNEFKEFNESGHYRARKQYDPKMSKHAADKTKGLVELYSKHEGQNHPELKNASESVGCMQCHGSIIKLDANKRPTADTWPNAGIGTVWPDGSVGNCVTCHTRHKFDISEARKPEACASCHLGPDHPDIEIYESSKHGQIYKAEHDKWKFDDAPGSWEPGSYRAPTCATCHMSGIGDLENTHNVSRRLHWNLWAKISKKRNSPDPMSMWTGDGDKGRVEMKKVCSNCHSKTHTNGFFKQGDKAVRLYNEAYWIPADKMRAELESKKLLKENPWNDEFQIIIYHLWHHEGRRARQGSLMGGPDYAHWHGFFELMQDMYKLKSIYAKRMKEGKIEE
jgi:hypothetical protein